MKKPRTPLKKRIWWIIAPAVLIAGALTAYLLVMGSAGASTRYDDAEKILSSYDPSAFHGFTLEDDGTLTVRLEKADLYWYAEHYALRKEIRARLDAQEGMHDAEFGFRIVDGKVVVYVSAKLADIIPVTYRAVMRNEGEGAQLRLRTEKVIFGTSRTLPEKRWPAAFASVLEIDLDRPDMLEGLYEARLEDNALLLKAEGLSKPVSGTLVPDAELLTALRVFGDMPELPAEIPEQLRALDGAPLGTEEIETLLRPTDNVPERLAKLMAFCEESSWSTLWEGKGEIVREYVYAPVETLAAQYRASLIKYVATEQNAYEKLLTTVRELYKSGGLCINVGSFSYTASKEHFDPAGLFAIDATALDSRIVFLRPGEDAGEIRLSDIPELGTIPISNQLALRNMDRKSAFDLGYILTTDGGMHVLLHYREDGLFVMREIRGDDLVAALLLESNPVLCPDALEAPAVQLVHAPEGDWSASVMEFLADTDE